MTDKDTLLLGEAYMSIVSENKGFKDEYSNQFEIDGDIYIIWAEVEGSYFYDDESFDHEFGTRKMGSYRKNIENVNILDVYKNDDDVPMTPDSVGDEHYNYIINKLENLIIEDIEEESVDDFDDSDDFNIDI
jgi:hypothetical protein